MSQTNYGDGDTWCKHRTSFSTEFKTCKVGVNFHEFPKGHDQIPCLGENTEAIVRCPKYEAWTAEEIAAKNAERDARMNRFGVIRPAIIAHVKKTGETRGEIPCPACKSGNVRYSQSTYNGHIHAACTTPGCASWME